MLKKIVKVLGFTCLFLSILFTFLFFFSKNHYYYTNYKIKYNKVIYQKQEEHLMLNIPKISLLKELPNISDSLNNVDKNIYVHPTSNFPEKLILAAHSGFGIHTYFSNLNQLNANDKIIIYNDNNIYNYEIKDIEYQLKTGELYLNKNYQLILITCTKNNPQTQTIYYAKLKNMTKNN